MSNELKYKINLVLKSLYPDKRKMDTEVVELQDTLQRQVLVYLLLAKSVSVINSSFVAYGIKGLKKYNKEFLSLIRKNTSQPTDSDMNFYEIEKYLGSLTMPKKGLLNLEFVFFDEESEWEHIIDADVIIESIKNNNFYHPLTHEKIKDFKSKVYLVYFPTKKLEDFRIIFTSERECDYVYEPVANNIRDDRKKRARALRILR